MGYAQRRKNSVENTRRHHPFGYSDIGFDQFPTVTDQNYKVSRCQVIIKFHNIGPIVVSGDIVYYEESTLRSPRVGVVARFCPIGRFLSHCMMI